jgi:dihydrodipicolinate synthase/N-acetylneuraminate lyase
MGFPAGSFRFKAALEILGLPIGPYRSPVAGIGPEKKAKMRAALEAAGLKVVG